jgi:hypothetical protein
MILFRLRKLAFWSGIILLAMTALIAVVGAMIGMNSPHDSSTSALCKLVVLVCMTLGVTFLALTATAFIVMVAVHLLIRRQLKLSGRNAFEVITTSAATTPVVSSPEQL